MDISVYHWVGFNLVILLLLALDLRHAHNNPHVIAVKEALLYSTGWILLALLFNLWIFIAFGPQHGIDFFTGYLLEKSLSIDNLFIFLLIFSHFKVPDRSKHSVLFYGILGAIIMRALLITAGITLIKMFSWIFILFGIFLIITGIRLAFNEKQSKDEEIALYQYLKKWIPFTESYHGEAFLIKMSGKWVATPLLAVLILIEITDLIFALDSVPAILGITTEPFIVYTSNIFAILGLRSLFFALEGIMKNFYLLHYALAFILVFIGFKMIFGHHLDIPTWATLSLIVVSITAAVAASIIFPQKNNGD